MTRPFRLKTSSATEGVSDGSDSALRIAGVGADRRSIVPIKVGFVDEADQERLEVGGEDGDLVVPFLVDVHDRR